MPAAGDLPIEYWKSGPRESASASLEVRGLTVTFGGVQALANISFDVAVGDTVAVVGPNGAGKSTLLNAISGLVGRATRGNVTFGGARIDPLSVAQRVNRRIGRSFQDPALVDKLSVLDNVVAGAYSISRYNTFDQVVRWRKASHAERDLEERARRMLAFVGLEHIAKDPAAGIAYGPRKLVDVARALMASPRLLLLDEPSSGLDKREQAAIVRVLQQLAASGELAILVVEHHMDVVEAAASRVIGLQAGEIFAHGPTAEVFRSETFRTTLTGTHRPLTKKQPSITEDKVS